jgi:hypothetical protein
MQATLDSPLILDPLQAATLRIINTVIDHGSRTVSITFELVDDTDKLLQRRTIVADGATVQTWIANQEATIYGRLLTKLGVTGTVA